MFQNGISNNKRIAKNTMYLYFRMLFSLIVNLFTSRIVLQVLGVLDFGIWNVVAGIIVLFSFLNTSMTSCTNRFLAYELGKNEKNNLNDVFSASITIHIGISLFILIVCETVGLWFLNSQLIIPTERIFAANVIYQFSIICSVFGIIQVPFVALVMAYEKMNAYAYIEIARTLLKLVIVYMLYFSIYDKLVTYGFLSFVVSFFVLLVYVQYCKRHWSYCKFSISTNFSFLKPMLTFSGYDLYGNVAVVARTQGVNMLLNMFFSATMNAANAIAMSVQGAVMTFASNILSAYRPQVVKTYANADYNTMVMLLYQATKITSFMLLLVTIPVLLELDYILVLWLKNPPVESDVLCHYVLIFNLVANLSSVVLLGIHATGNIKRPSIVNGSLYLLVIPFSYVAFKFGMPAEFAYIFNIVAVMIGVLQNAYTLSKYVSNFKLLYFFKCIISKYFFIASFIYWGLKYVQSFIPQGFSRLFIIVISSSLVLTAFTYFFIFDKEEKQNLIKMIKRHE